MPSGRPSPKLVKSGEGNIVTPPGETIREIHSGDIGFAEATVNEAKLHFHKKTHEYYYVLEGSGKVQLGDTVVELEKGDFLHIPPRTAHKAFSEEGFKLLVITRPAWNPKDHHLLEE